MTQGDFNEIVRVTYDYSAAYRSIDEMLARLSSLDATLEAHGKTAGQAFSRGFDAGLTGAYEAIDRLKSYMAATVAGMSQGMEQLVAQADVRPRTTSVPAYRVPAGQPGAGQFVSEDVWRSRYGQPGQGVGGGGEFLAAGDTELRARVAAYWQERAAVRRLLLEAVTEQKFLSAALNPSNEPPLISLGGGGLTGPGALRGPGGLGLGGPGLLNGLPLASYFNRPTDPSVLRALGLPSPTPSLPWFEGFWGRNASMAMVPAGPVQDWTAWAYPRTGPTSPIGGGMGAGTIPLYGPAWTRAMSGGAASGAAPGTPLWDQIMGRFFGGGGGGAGGPPAGFQGFWQSPNNFNQAAQAAIMYGNSVQTAGGKVNDFNARFSRHLTWIAQGIAIWGALNLTIGVIRNYTDELMRLEALQSRLGFITGQGMGATVGQLQQAAGYGITPAQAAPGLVTRAQLGLTNAQNTQAMQLAQIFGMDQYEAMLQEIYQTQQRANAAGLAQVDILDYMATAYAEVNGPASAYFDALQYGIALHGQLGLSAEQAGIAIGKMANALGETSPETVKNLLSRIILQLDKPEVRQQLEGLGITGPSFPEYFQQLATGVAGGGARAERIVSQLSFGLQGAQQRTEFRTLLAAYGEYLQAVQNGQTDLREFGDLHREVTDDAVVQVNKLKAAWDTFLLSAGAETGLAGGLTTMLEYWTGLLGDIGTGLGAISQFAKNRPIDNLQGARGFAGAFNVEAIGRFGQSPMDLLNPWAWVQVFAAAVERFDRISKRASVAGRAPGEAGEAEQETLFPKGLGEGMGARRLRRINDLKNRPPEFGGFQTFGEGLDWDRFVRRVGEIEGQIQKEVPEYELDRRTYAFYDESAGYYRKILGDNEAIRRALEEQTDLLKTITGVFNVPAGGEILVPFFALQAGFRPDYLLNQGATTSGTTAGGAASGGWIQPRHYIEPPAEAWSRYVGQQKAEQLGMPGAPKAIRPAGRPNETEKTVPQVPAINITLRNVVMLNGRVIQDEIAKMLRRQITTTSSSVSGSGGNNQLLG